MRKNILFGVTLFSISFFSSLFQDSVAQEISETNTFFITTNLGYSPQSVIFLGKTPDTQMKYSYVGFGKQIKSPFETITMYITGGFFPFVEFSYPKRDEGSRRDLVAGFGISPLGYSFVKSFRFFELETGTRFQASNGQIYELGQLRRKRYACIELATKRTYLFAAHSEVKIVEK